MESHLKKNKVVISLSQDKMQNANEKHKMQNTKRKQSLISLLQEEMHEQMSGYKRLRRDHQAALAKLEEACR